MDKLDKLDRALIVFSLVLLLVVGFSVRKSAEGILFDVPVMENIHSNITDGQTTVMKGITFLGSKYFFGVVGFIFIVVFMNKGDRKAARMVFSSIAGAYILNAAVKILVMRTRPIDYMLIEKTSPSFPSGHSMVSMSFYTTMSYILTRYMHTDRDKKMIAVASVLISIGIAYSRLYLGVHWPTDVVVGAIVGYTYSRVSRKLVRP